MVLQGMKPKMDRASSTASAALAVLGILVLSSTACSSAPSRPEISKTERARMLVEVANGALLEGDSTSALENLLKAEQQDPSLPELHHSKAIAFAMKEDLSTALAEAREAIRLHPKYSDANNTLGKLLMDAGRLDEAVGPLTTAAKDPLYRDAPRAFTNLGILYHRKQNTEKALYNLERAIALAPTSACIAYYWRGQIRLEQSRANEAIRDFEKASRGLCAGNGEAYLALGMAYEKTQQFDLARKKFLEIQERFPSTSLADQAVNHLRFLP